MQTMQLNPQHYYTKQPPLVKPGSIAQVGRSELPQQLVHESHQFASDQYSGKKLKPVLTKWRSSGWSVRTGAATDRTESCATFVMGFLTSDVSESIWRMLRFVIQVEK